MAKKLKMSCKQQNEVSEGNTATNLNSDTFENRFEYCVKEMKKLDAVKEYLKAIRSTGMVDLFTDERIIIFVKELGPDAANEYFKAIADTKAVDALTNEKVLTENVINFANELGYHAAYGYFEAIADTKAVDALTDQKIFTRNIINFIEKLGPDVAGRYFHVIGYTKAVDALTNEKVLMENVINLVEENEPDVAEKYFYTIGYTKAVDALTDVNVTRFPDDLDDLDYDAVERYFYAIAYVEAVHESTNENVMSFAKELGPDVAEMYFKAIVDTKAVDALTTEKVIDFAKELRSEVAEMYFKAIADTKAVDALTNEKVMGFAKELGYHAAYGYFEAIINTNAVDVLTNENFTTKKLAELLKYLEDGSYFEEVAITRNPELLRRGAIAIAISAGSDFSTLIKSKGIIKNAIDYYDLLSKSLKNIGEMEDVEINYDEEFCRIAMANVKNGSATLLIHDIASTAYEINSKKLLSIDMNTLFSIGPNKIKQYVQKSILPVFEKFGIKGYMAFDIEESFILLKDIEYIEENSKQLNAFIERRINNLKQISPFNNKEITSKVISEKQIGESKVLEISQKTALETMVYAINGSRDMTNFDNAKKLLIESGYFQEKDILSVFGRWASIKGPYKKQLAVEFNNYLQNPSKENARKVIDVFKNAVAERDIVIKEPIYDFIGKLEPLIMGSVKNISKGDRVVAYTDNKNNIIKIKSSETGACCFIGGVNEYAALKYALDSGIALINFTVTDSSITAKEFEKQKVHGVAICAFGRMENNKPVLLVDSFEGGITLNNALKKDYSIVVDALIKFAIDTGCEAIAINKSIGNATAVKFAEYIDAPTKRSEMKILTEEEQYLETAIPNAKVKIIDLSDYLNGKVAESNPLKIFSELVR